MTARLLVAATMLLTTLTVRAGTEHDHDSPSFRLLEAILRDDLKEAAQLIAAGTDPVRDPEGYCLAFAPIVRHSPGTLRFLIEHGADVNCQTPKGLKQWTLLGHAVALDRVDIARLLLTLGADPNRGDLLNKSFTPFVDAIEQCRMPDRRTPNHLLLIKEMIKRGADVNAVWVWPETESRESVLSLAIRQCPPTVTEGLLAAGANPNGFGRDAYGEQTSPLGSAIETGAVQKVDILLRAGADATATEISKVAGRRNVSKDIVEMLRARGAVISESNR